MKTADIRLIVTDMDGTLLDANHQLPPGFPEIVKDLRARGIHWAIASGRQLANLQAQFEPLGVPIDLMAENGALVLAGGEQKPFFADLTPIEVFRHIVTISEHVQRATPVLCGADVAWVKAVYPEHFPVVKTYFAETAMWTERYEIEADSICKVAIYHPQAATVLYPKLAPFESASMRIILSSPCWVDVQPTRIHKGHGLQALLQRYALRPDQVIVFGDYLNDVEMMTMGTQSVAMANAHPDLKAECRYTTTANTENGVITFLQTIGLLS